MVSALVVRSGITILIDKRTGAAIGDPISEFMPTGRLIRTKNEKGRSVRPDGAPKFRNVGAVITIEEEERSDYHFTWYEPKILVAHNPIASNPISNDIWKEYPQLIAPNGNLKWSDGYKLD